MRKYYIYKITSKFLSLNSKDNARDCKKAS